MATKVKSDCPKQDPVFADNDNRDVIIPKNENSDLPTLSTSDQTTPGKGMPRSGFTNKSPIPLMVTHNDLQRNVQQLVDDINAKRKRDADSLTEIKKALDMQLNSSGNILEETLVGIYEENSKLIQDKLQEIFATLDRISNLERELCEFKQALGLLYQDLRDPNL